LNPEELSLFFFSDFGLNMPEDGLYTMEETFKADPQLCARFVQASLRGWLYAFNHEDETVELVMKHADAAHTGTNRAHQRWMLAHMKDLIMPGGDKNRLGKLRPEDYTHAGQLLKESGMIDRLPRFDDFYVGSQ
jgi:NitT/TauT family transport system substrate-binding protein